MSAALSAPTSLGPHQRLHTVFERMRTLSREAPAPTYKERKERLQKLLKLTIDNRAAFAEAASKDFGHRSKHETIITDAMPVVLGLQHTIKHLKKWMRPERRSMLWVLHPARAEVRPQPLGVVGVIAPWNYPFQLALSPITGALAAGNRVILKPSELAPACSALMAKLLGEAFSEDVLAVVEGGADVAEAFCKLPFDHLLFTGSTRLGKVVMKAAAENLTPVTLELGGKSPAILHESFPLDVAAESICFGKLVNAGQTCLASDYAMVHESKVDAFVEAMRTQVARGLPTLAENPDWTAIVNDRHYARLRAYIDEAVQKGAKAIELNPANEKLDPAKRKMAPTLLLNVNDDMQVMQDEIFGPILPVMTYRTLDEALRYVNAHPRPLGLYYFDRDRTRIDHVLDHTTSGGACINASVLHCVTDDLPFGGVGPSGMGTYHGKAGFDTFSNKKAVFRQSRLQLTKLLMAPYGKLLERLVDLIVA